MVLGVLGILHLEILACALWLLGHRLSVQHRKKLEWLSRTRAIMMIWNSFMTRRKCKLVMGIRRPSETWLDGQRLKHIAPLIQELSMNKKWSVKLEMHNNAWMNNIDMTNGLSTTHVGKPFKLWTLLQDNQRHDGIEDTIKWKVTTDACYSTYSVYLAQFSRITSFISVQKTGRSLDRWCPACAHGLVIDFLK